jgi:hypothetical protein
MLAQAQAGARCDWRSIVDRHFQRRIRPAEESGLRVHLTHCPLCRRRYDRHLLLEQLLPRRREDPADRLATGLGLRTVRAPALGGRWPLTDWRWVVAGMALGLGMLALVLSSPDRARGGRATIEQMTAAGRTAGNVAGGRDAQQERPDAGPGPAAVQAALDAGYQL